ncbi:MAG: hypothetical protein AB7F86_12955 [Bdellovibrionales bacterium]
MLRYITLAAAFVLAQIIFLSHAQADTELVFCDKWAGEAPQSETFKCSNGKSYVTGMGFCTTETSESTVEDMIAGLKVTRLFCAPEKSGEAFDCSHDEDPETLACAKEFFGQVASLE